ncbi:TPA: hypothetical protein N0F65_003782 [Lagenidium giganteum]|uniref:Calpain catalytic domain-containing protein n=1 Tax=Lagenidium giganteum TaxID=4803 RepID=A0AAV2YI46_9STRA|nr:TPA: hypothetical protein N0F65_003782 [Lagenidium giganteum]
MPPPLPAPVLPPADTVKPIWTPLSTPLGVFPEWPGAAALANEDWGHMETPFVDETMPVTHFPLPADLDSTAEVAWKRPHQFLPPIVDAPPPVAAAQPAPVAEPAKKEPPGKKGAPPPKKSAAPPEPEPPKKPAAPPKYAYVLFVEPHEADRQAVAAQTHAQPPALAMDPKKGASQAPAVSAAAAAAATPAATGAGAGHGPVARQLTREFRRLWSPQEEEDLAKWRKEEERIERERENRERVYMAYEEAIAFVVNDRPRAFVNEEDIDVDDLVDDGVDDDDADVAVGASESSPYGILPPAKIDITPNAVSKPEIPHGETVHPDMASCLLIIHELYEQWTHDLHDDTKPPFLWEAIYPQDARGVPVYNPGGKYSVKLFVLGKWRRIDIDDRLPVLKDGNIAYLTSSMRSEIWPALLVKAIYKVASWLHGFAAPDVIAAAMNPTESTIWHTTHVLSTLTAWKTSKWKPAIQDQNPYQQLAEVPRFGVKFLPLGSFSTEEDIGESVAVEEDHSGATGAEPAALDEPEVYPPWKTRVVICCNAAKSASPLRFREASLLTSLVGDVGNANLKCTSFNGPVGISEEVAAVEATPFLLLHPPFKHNDLILHTWTKEVHMSEESEHVEWRRFVPPQTSYVVLKVPAGEATEERGSSKIGVLLTLARVSSVVPSEAAEATWKETAAHLRVVADGSAIIIEETEASNSNDKQVVRRPKTIHLDTCTSAYLELDRSRPHHVFRVYPQMSLLYGYSLEVASSAHINIVGSNEYWRNILDVHVVHTDGVQPIMLPNTWNVLFKQNLDFVRNTAEPTPGNTDPDAPPPPVQCVRLFLDLYLSDDALAPFVHMYVVDNDSNAVKRVPRLCSSVSMPLNVSGEYTLVVDCAPRNQAVPEGTWKLMLGSSMPFVKSSTAASTKLTSFGGTYVANKPLLFFRDVILAPKKTFSTTMQLLALLGDSVADHLAIKLEIFDLATGALLSSNTAVGQVHLLQCPRYTKAADDPDEEKSGYIVQGSLDKAVCVVPHEFRSVRPFRNIPKEKVEGSEEAAVDEAPSHAVPEGTLRWKLNIWSIDDVALEPDRTSENRMEAIRQAWAESAKSRETNGTVSRLLFLGQVEAAEAKMKEDNLTEDQMMKLRNRVAWLQRALGARPDGPYLEKTPIDESSERLRTPEEFAHDEAALQSELENIRIQIQQRKDQRAAEKEERNKAVNSLVQTVKDERAEAIKKRQALALQKEEIKRSAAAGAS